MNNAKVGKSLGNIEFSANSMKLMAESYGVTNLEDDAALHLAKRITEGVKKLVEDAAKFMKHSNRDILKTSDVNSALKIHKMEPLYGYLYSEEPSDFTYSPAQNISFVETKELDLDDIIDEAIEDIKAPLEPSFFCFWLAKRKGETVWNGSEDSCQVFFNHFLNKSTKTKSKKSSEAIEHFKDHSWETVAVKNLTTDDISTEMQIYYKEITESCVGSEESKRAEALNSLNSTTTLHEIMPRISTFILEGVKVNIVECNLALLIYLMRMVKAVLENRNIYLENYLHQIIPSVLSCTISRKLCVRPDFDNHYALRNFAARLLSQICRTFSNPVNRIQDRVVAVLNETFKSENIYLASLYGSVVGLMEVGNATAKNYIVPRLKQISLIIDEELYTPSEFTGADNTAIDRITSFLCKNSLNIMKNMRKPNESLDCFIESFGSLGSILYKAVQISKNAALSNNSKDNQIQSLVSQQSNKRLMKLKLAKNEQRKLKLVQVSGNESSVKREIMETPAVDTISFNRGDNKENVNSMPFDSVLPTSKIINLKLENSEEDSFGTTLLDDRGEIKLDNVTSTENKEFHENLNCSSLERSSMFLNIASSSEEEVLEEIIIDDLGAIEVVVETDE